MKRRLLMILLALMIILSGCAGKSEEPGVTENEYPVVETGFKSVSKYGNIMLTVSPDTMRELGYEPGDIITVSIGEVSVDMPVGTDYTDADSGEPICCYKYSSSNDAEVVYVAINAGNFMEVNGIGTSHPIDQEPEFEWDLSDGFTPDMPIYISMKEKQGYAEEYAMHQHGSTRSNKREDYDYLTDAEYANFRAVETTGMGKGTLYRSSSPVNPAYKRNTEADEALVDAGITSIVNMADSEAKMRSYDGYAMTYYSQCVIMPLDMAMDFTTDDFRQKLAQGFRFIAESEGPYLIHCNEGKDRTGFAVALLEALMGADINEIIDDYMRTFYNFYKIDKSSPQYMEIAQGNILQNLEKAFGVTSLTDSRADLKSLAEQYLIGIGMSSEEIEKLRENLSADHN